MHFVGLWFPGIGFLFKHADQSILLESFPKGLWLVAFVFGTHLKLSRMKILVFYNMGIIDYGEKPFFVHWKLCKLKIKALGSGSRSLTKCPKNKIKFPSFIHLLPFPPRGMG